MKRRGFTLWDLLAVAVFILVVAAILLPTIGGRPPAQRDRAVCQTLMKQIALSTAQYLADSDKHFPPARNGRYSDTKSPNWARLLTPYFVKDQKLQCPSDGLAQKSTQISYGYNQWLSGKAAKKIEHPDSVIVNFEVIADPNDWTQTGTSRSNVTASTRHLEGSSYAFADGHIKWLKPEKVTATPGGQWTFVPR